MTHSKNDEIYINVEDCITSDFDWTNLTTDDTTFTISNEELFEGNNVIINDNTISNITLNTDTYIDTYRYPKERNELDEEKIEAMCNQYPALKKVWRNFKSVYDMVLQDYKGKQKAGEIDNDVPF